METNEMTPERSLQIINEAIEKSRKDYEKRGGIPMIIWGVIVFIVAIAVWITFKLTGDVKWNFLWFCIPVIGWPVTAIYSKRHCKSSGNTFISRFLGQIWGTYGIFATVLCTVFAFVAPQFTGYITAVLLGFSAVLTGMLLKNSYISIGGFITGLGCTIALLFTQNADVPLFFAVASLLNLIIPGIMMNRKAE